MPNLNKVMLMGNLTRDPEVNYTPKGTAVGSLSIAINDSYKAQDGTVKETVTYVDIEVWGRQAENCKQYLVKGRPIFVEGKLKLEQWEQEGQKRSKLKVIAERVQFLGGAAERTSKPAETDTPHRDTPPPPDDDSIPF